MDRILRIGLLLLAVGLLSPAPPSLWASAESHGGDAKKSEKKEAGKADNGTIAIGPLVVNVLSKGSYKFLRLGMEVQCEDNAAAECLVKPAAKEDLLLMLSTKLAEDLLSAPGKMILRKELVDLFSKYTGPGKVKGLYFTEFVFQ